MSKVIDITREAITPTLESMGVEIVDMEYVKGHGNENPTLWIYVYHQDGVDLNLLEKVHNTISPILDEADPTDNAPYILNVSSPGLDRPFKSDRDFERNMGKDVEVRLYTNDDGKKVYEGKLAGYGEEVVIVIDGNEKRFAKKNVAKVSLSIKFE